MSLINKVLIASFILVGLLSLAKYISTEATISLINHNNSTGTVIAHEPGV